VLHEEVDALPERYRAPLVLCYLEGVTQQAAAAQLELAKSTLRERLERGRALLRTRLTRRGLGPAVLLVAAAWPWASAPACVSTSLVSRTVKAASLFAAGQVVPAGVISTQVASLTQGVLKSMLLCKLKVAVLVVLTLGVLGIGASALTHRTVAAEPQSRAPRSSALKEDQGNLKETVLALEKRLWDAHTTQDVNTFRNLMADDFVGFDVRHNSYDKAGTLDYVSKFRVVEPVMKNARVVVLNATSAIVTYEIRYKVATPGKKELETVSPHLATTAWAMRGGKWWYVYCEARELAKDGIRWKEGSYWKTAEPLSIQLEKINAKERP
jgi:hypothetical protein